YLDDQTWESAQYEGYTLPEHLPPRARAAVASMGSPDALCKELVWYFSRFKELIPTERLYTHERSALSKIRLANLKYHGLDALLSQAKQNLAAMKRCTDEKPCELIGCP